MNGRESGAGETKWFDEWTKKKPGKEEISLNQNTTKMKGRKARPKKGKKFPVEYVPAARRLHSEKDDSRICY